MRINWWRIAGGVLAIAGVVVVVVLLVTGPELRLRDVNGVPGDRPDQIVACYSTLQVPDGLPRVKTQADTDAQLNGLDNYANPGDSARLDTYCDRLRSQRQAIAVLVAIPTVLLGAVVLASMVSRRQLDDQQPAPPFPRNGPAHR